MQRQCIAVHAFAISKAAYCTAHTHHSLSGGMTPDDAGALAFWYKPQRHMLHDKCCSVEGCPNTGEWTQSDPRQQPFQVTQSASQEPLVQQRHVCHWQHYRQYCDVELTGAGLSCQEQENWHRTLLMDEGAPRLDDR